MDDTLVEQAGLAETISLKLHYHTDFKCALTGLAVHHSMEEGNKVREHLNFIQCTASNGSFT